MGLCDERDTRDDAGRGSRCWPGRLLQCYFGRHLRGRWRGAQHSDHARCDGQEHPRYYGGTLCYWLLQFRHDGSIADRDRAAMDSPHRIRRGVRDELPGHRRRSLPARLSLSHPGLGAVHHHGC